jgi:gas vesicle protein
MILNKEKKMINENQEYKYSTNTFLNVLVAMVVGGLAGAIAMLLLAPQSGKETRKLIQKKSVELRDQTTEMVEDTVAQVRSNVNKIALGGREKINELKKHGQELAVEQLDHVSKAAKAGKKAIKNS